MPETDTDEFADPKQEPRNKTDRRSVADRRTVEIEREEDERRDKTAEYRRSWIARRQAAEWREK